MSVLDGIFRIVVALFACVLPRGVWIRWTDRLPLSHMIIPSAVLTLGLGGVFGVVGYLDFALDTASRTNQAMLQIAEQQNSGTADRGVDASAGMAASLTMLAMVTFAFFTPKGIGCTYLVLSGLYRVLSCVANEPQGDPLLTFLRWCFVRTSGRTRESFVKLDRERRQGREVPDRMKLGVDCDFPRADFVIIASREKVEWTQGAVLFTRRGCFRVGVAAERETPEGLRTLYPLTEVGQADVMRKIVRCELPRLEAAVKEPEPVEV